MMNADVSPSTGYYADPSSPIASTPNRGVKPKRLGVETSEPLSPMRPAVGYFRSEDEADETEEALFSPSLKLPDHHEGETEDSKHSHHGPLMHGHRRPSHGDVSAPAVEPCAFSKRAASEPGWDTVMVDETTDASDDLDEFNPYLFIKLLPKYGEVVPRPRPIVLPRKESPHKISLVLDLDETLVHCSIEPMPKPDLTFPVEFNGQKYHVYVKKRPYLTEFLEAVAKRFEVTVFTASQRVYAERLLDLLDPTRSLVSHRLFRDTCLNVEGNFLKDLSVLGRDLKATVLVDNSPHAFGYQLDNGIPIESWFDDPQDTELLKLFQFLQTLEHVADVRPRVREQFKTYQRVAQARV